MKTLKTLQQDYDGYKPKAGDEQKFKAKHVVKHSHNLSKPTEDDDMFKATNVKVASRDPGHGYNAGEDEDVYEERTEVKDKAGNVTGWMETGKWKKSTGKPGSGQGAAANLSDKARREAEKLAKQQKAKKDFDNYQSGNVRANWKEETEQMDEGNMPRNVIRAKERIKSMTPREFYQAHPGKSASDLQSMAWRHGYGKDNDVYVKKHNEGQQEDVAKEADPVVKKSLGEMMEAMKNKEPVGVKIRYTHPKKKATSVTHFTAKDAQRGEEEMSSQGYEVEKRELVYGKEST